LIVRIPGWTKEENLEGGVSIANVKLIGFFSLISGIILTMLSAGPFLYLRDYFYRYGELVYWPVVTGLCSIIFGLILLVVSIIILIIKSGKDKNPK